MKTSFAYPSKGGPLAAVLNIRPVGGNHAHYATIASDKVGPRALPTFFEWRSCTLAVASLGSVCLGIAGACGRVRPKKSPTGHSCWADHDCNV